MVHGTETLPGLGTARPDPEFISLWNGLPELLKLQPQPSTGSGGARTADAR
jgi:hypothetical protein